MTDLTTDVVEDALKPQEVLNKLNIIDIQIKSFSGYMTRQDEILQEGEEVLFTKGSIKIIDPAHVKMFSNSRVASKRICQAVGVSLAGGYAISEDSTKDVLKRLVELRATFYREKKLFLQNYHAYVEEQANYKPEHYDLVKSRKPTLEYVDKQLQFEIRVYKMVAADIKGVDNFINDEVGDLKWQLAKEISQDIKASWKGKDGSDKADGRTIGMLKRIQGKLKSLVFLDKRIGEVQKFIGEAIKQLPDAKITGRDYLFLVGVIETLADPKKLLNDPLNLEALNPEPELFIQEPEVVEPVVVVSPVIEAPAIVEVTKEALIDEQDDVDLIQQPILNPIVHAPIADRGQFSSDF